LWGSVRDHARPCDLVLASTLARGVFSAPWVASDAVAWALDAGWFGHCMPRAISDNTRAQAMLGDGSTSGDSRNAAP
jgi:hypothetical protein